jgi:hypothetical protein
MLISDRLAADRDGSRLQLIEFDGNERSHLLRQFGGDRFSN